MASLGLVVALPVPAKPLALSRLGYMKESAGSPVCLAIAMFAGCLGLGAFGVIGAFAAVGTVLALGVCAARYPQVRKHIDEQEIVRAKAKREYQRLKQLRPTGMMRIQHYNELRTLVDEIERLDPVEAARFELADLLDHYVRLAVNHQRCSDALRLAGTRPLPAIAPTNELTTRSRRRREIMQRRMLHRDECVKTMERLVDELEGIDELIRLVAQRTAGPHLDVELDREIDRRLWEIDEVDAALHQLSA